MANEHDDAHRKFSTLYVGVVLDNADPLRLGRVRVRIPGVLDQGTGWALPLGMPGAGGKKRGSFSVPPQEAEVGVFFNMGDPDRPYYISGNYGHGEVPDEVEDAEPAEAWKVWSHETDRFKFLFDGRKGKQLLQFRDKKTDDVIEIDGVKLGVRIKATSAISIECDGAIAINGSNLTIQGRYVAKNGKSI